MGTSLGTSRISPLGVLATYSVRASLFGSFFRLGLVPWPFFRVGLRPLAAFSGRVSAPDRFFKVGLRPLAAFSGQVWPPENFFGLEHEKQTREGDPCGTRKLQRNWVWVKRG